MAIPFDQAHEEMQLSATTQLPKAIFSKVTLLNSTLLLRSDQIQAEISVLAAIVVANILIELMRQRVQSPGKLVRGELDGVFVYTLASQVLRIQI